MRIYTDFNTALNEIKRDLAEMGIDVHPQTMQDKVVADDPDYATKECQNYIYTVVDAYSSLKQLKPVQPWAALEFGERVDNKRKNPGEAYLHRDEVWNEFLHDGKFSYTYGERIGLSVEKIIDEIGQHPESRQLYLSIWDPKIDIDRIGGKMRVPCSLGYLFQVRGGKLHITYFMRSCDYATHMQNDIYLALRLLEYVAACTGYETGDFTQYIGSLHIYKKDIKGVF
jgi:thymidylate synthase